MFPNVIYPQTVGPLIDIAVYLTLPSHHESSLSVLLCTHYADDVRKVQCTITQLGLSKLHSLALILAILEFHRKPGL